MSINLMSYVKDQISDEAISSIGSLIGENSSVTKSAISSALPTILKGIINRGDTTQNASALRKFIGEQNIGTNAISMLLGANTKDKKDSFLSTGIRVVDFLFGSSKSNLLGNISKAVGLANGKSNMLTQSLAPLALSAVSKLTAKENYSDEQLATYLNSQKGIFKDHVAANKVVENKSTVAETRHASTKSESGGGMGWLKFLLPLLLLAAAAWFFLGKGNKKEGHKGPKADKKERMEKMPEKKMDNVAKPTTTTTTTSTATATAKPMDKVEDDTTSNNTGLTIDANGNLVDANGKIIAKAGEFSEKDGSYVDASGKKIGLVGKIGKAIGGAATKTADAFKDVFTGLFKSKEKVGSTYSLSRIVFDDESHKITNFSKNEVEGLANALKSLPDAKIQVQVHSTDGDSNKKNKEFTKMRAEVVRDMLVTLGVNKKQISFKGMGKDDAAKASGEKVEIMVEQTVN
jgi:outer membrane protein OmpA-like peptidoglycan-associated protein